MQKFHQNLELFAFQFTSTKKQQLKNKPLGSFQFLIISIQHEQHNSIHLAVASDIGFYLEIVHFPFV